MSVSAYNPLRSLLILKKTSPGTSPLGTGLWPLGDRLLLHQLAILPPSNLSGMTMGLGEGRPERGDAARDASACATMVHSKRTREPLLSARTSSHLRSLVAFEPSPRVLLSL